MTALHLVPIIAATDPQNIFDPSTAKLGGVLILTVHLTVMSQLKKFFLYNKLKQLFDLLNFPLAFIECLIVTPPWPWYSPHAWGAYVAASIGLATLASITAQKVRDTPEAADVSILNAPSPPGAQTTQEQPAAAPSPPLRPSAPTPFVQMSDEDKETCA